LWVDVYDTPAQDESTFEPQSRLAETQVFFMQQQQKQQQQKQ